MALIICPDCGCEVSTAAVDCPKCGRPMSPVGFEDRTVVREVAPVVVERDSFPKWIFIPLGVLGVVLLFLLFALFRQENDDQQNVNLKIASKDSSSPNINSPTRAGSSPNQITIPPTSADPSVSNVQPVTPANGATVTDIPADAAKIDRGFLSLEAKVSDRSGSPKPVKAEKFYLLDKDLESILNDAGIEPISGQTLRNSFGLSIFYPDRYAALKKDALAEINKHVKYDVTTDADGKAQMRDIKPDSYYLFAITKTSDGFAIWSNEIQVNAGQNILNLSPQPLTAVPEE